MALSSVEDQLAGSLIDRLPLLGLGLGNRHLGEYISVDQVIFHRSFILPMLGLRCFSRTDS